MSLFKKKKTQKIEPEDALTQRTVPDNALVLGSSGSGKGTHPWDFLKPCHCGCEKRPLLMYEKDKPYYCGGPIDSVYAYCPSCGRHTIKGSLSEAIVNWNRDNLSFFEEEYADWLENMLVMLSSDFLGLVRACNEETLKTVNLPDSTETRRAILLVSENAVVSNKRLEPYEIEAFTDALIKKHEKYVERRNL